jgi:hypothetical protein
MNRLVREFGWTAKELADFYLDVAYLALTALAVTYGYAAYRQVRKTGASP